MSVLLRRTTRTILGVAAALLAACGTDSPSATDPDYTPVATSIEVADFGLLRDGDVKPLTATVKDQRGRSMNGVPVAFASVDPTIAVIGAGNLLTALRVGTTELVAVAGAVQKRIPLTIVLHPATDLEVNVTSLSLRPLEQRTIVATLRGLDDRILQGRQLVWQSTNPDVLRVDNQGHVTAIAPGNATITVSYGSLLRGVNVHVLGTAIAYAITSIDGRTLPANVYEEIIEREDGSRFTAIERLEAGSVSVSDAYQVNLTIADIERHTLQGNVIERVIRRRQVRDAGQVQINWLDGRMFFLSTKVGGLSHEVLPGGLGYQLHFRIGGTNTIWGLAMQLVP